MVRIVKLTFKTSELESFLNHFETVKEKINDFPGCKGMQLLLDKNNKGVVFTYSKWESEEALEKYRNSDLFQSIWPVVKKWFDAKPQAWSTSVYFDGFSS